MKKSNEEDEERNAVIDAILAALSGPSEEERADLVNHFDIEVGVKEDCPTCQKIRALILGNPAPRENEERLRVALKSMVRQFAYVSDGPKYRTGGLMALEDAFEVLGWSDPKDAPEIKCQAEGCIKEATCGTPTKDGYKRLCGKHYKILGTPAPGKEEKKE
jgi:hypothetical protein